MRLRKEEGGRGTVQGRVFQLSLKTNWQRAGQKCPHLLHLWMVATRAFAILSTLQRFQQSKRINSTIETKQSVINLSGLWSSLAGLEKTQLDSNHGSLHFRQLSQVGHLLPAPETTRETKGRRQRCSRSGRDLSRTH